MSWAGPTGAEGPVGHGSGGCTCYSTVQRGDTINSKCSIHGVDGTANFSYCDYGVHHRWKQLQPSEYSKEPVGKSSGEYCVGSPPGVTFWSDRKKTWIRYYRDMADLVSTKSKDQSTKIGAVIVGRDNSVVSTGYNSFPRGINDNVPERQKRPEKYFWFEHAERNAIYNAARNGVSTVGTTMYLNCRLSCPDCARAIINSGVQEVWFNEDHGATGEQFKEGYSVAIQMFREAGIITHYYHEIED